MHSKFWNRYHDNGLVDDVYIGPWYSNWVSQPNQFKGRNNILEGIHKILRKKLRLFVGRKKWDNFENKITSKFRKISKGFFQLLPSSGRNRRHLKIAKMMKVNIGVTKQFEYQGCRVY